MAYELLSARTAATEAGWTPVSVREARHYITYLDEGRSPVEVRSIYSPVVCPYNTRYQAKSHFRSDS
ncbi:hypothetical protein BKA82DRAFT_326634 [Pisolithus tinctorius]|uniref:Uncharacterized protein n=1 Tax=Pisolithus tinctorius Marx 270 TaxID=870435 RepID=A0A0C3PJK6_PISTI|nr:hypothetical protein BKA82DRAFT_326634 [Pisolithus tinctorius]KIO08796.1 hypothetical protein M404DRAFT_326634 [Pisolithus tinctorius Marx 270]